MSISGEVEYGRGALRYGLIYRNGVHQSKAVDAFLVPPYKSITRLMEA